MILGKTVISCPNETSELSVIDLYDAYQWYKREYPNGEFQNIDNNQPTLTVSNPIDVGYAFKVIARKGLCSYQSPEVLIDAYNIIPPTLTAIGVEMYNNNGDVIVCNQHNVTLIIEGITEPKWYINDELITNYFEDTLKVMQSGFYTVRGKHQMCPQYNVELGVDSYFKKANTPQPLIEIQSNSVLKLLNYNDYGGFQWYKNNQPISGAYNSQYNATQPGAYSLEAIDNIGCTEKSTQYDVYTLTAYEPTPNSYNSTVLQLYPNPAQTNITLTTTQFIETVNIWNMNGKLVLHYNNPKNTLIDNPLNIEIQHLAKGAYLTQVLTKRDQAYQKTEILFVKQ